MYNLESLGNILIEGKPAVGKTSFIEYYLNKIKRKHIIICDYMGVNLYNYKNNRIEYYDRNNYDELYSNLLDIIENNRNYTTYIIIDEFSDFISVYGKTKSYELFDYLLVNYKKHKIKLILSSQINCFSTNMKRYCNTYIKLNNRY